MQTNNGEVSFASNAELEIISATSNRVRGIIDPVSSEFVFRLNIRSFNGFNTELQRQHFYDNYMETDKFPTAEFSGKIIERIDFSQDGTYDVRAKGDLDIHGQKQTRIIRCKLVLRNNSAYVDAHFVVPLAEHNIRIPKIVSQKIATEIDVAFKAHLTTAPPTQQ